MARITMNNALALGGLALAGFGAYYVIRKGVGGAAAAAGEVAVDAAKGLVIGIGKGAGIPETNMDACARAIHEGRTWDASFACPAGTFLKSLVGVKPEPKIAPDPDSAAWDAITARKAAGLGAAPSCGCGANVWSPEAWIGLAALGTTLFLHSRNRRAHGRR